MSRKFILTEYKFYIFITCTQNLGELLSLADTYLLLTDPPEIEMERSWIHSGEGDDAKIVCIVHGEPPPTVSIQDTPFVINTYWTYWIYVVHTFIAVNHISTLYTHEQCVILSSKRSVYLTPVEIVTLKQIYILQVFPVHV